MSHRLQNRLRQPDVVSTRRRSLRGRGTLRVKEDLVDPSEEKGPRSSEGDPSTVLNFRSRGGRMKEETRGSEV